MRLEVSGRSISAVRGNFDHISPSGRIVCCRDQVHDVAKDGHELRADRHRQEQGDPRARRLQDHLLESAPLLQGETRTRLGGTSRAARLGCGAGTLDVQPSRTHWPMRTAHIHGSIPAARSVLRAEYEGNSGPGEGERSAPVGS